MTSGLITEFYYADTPAATHHHRHNNYQMLYILEGSVHCEIAGSTVECTAPALLFIGSHEPHIITATSERYVRYVLTLDPHKAAEQISPAVLQSVFSFHPLGFAHGMDVSPIADEIRAQMAELYREWCLPAEEKLPCGTALLFSALLYRLRLLSPAHFAKKPCGAAETIVSSVRMELECNITERLDLTALAERHHVSRYYLAHIFREVTGYSMQEYLMLCRISYACQLLADDSMPVRKIAEESGFRDMSNFSRSFKKIIGMSPTNFRRKHA